MFQRFRQDAPAGQIRISRDVAVQADEATSEIFVVSDAAAVVGEVLTLALVSSDGEMEFRVRVAESRPHLIDGAMRHRLRLEVITATSLPD